jgi:hypothetical protein
MGERADRVNVDEGVRGPRVPERIEEEIQTLRGDLDGLIGELDRRRHAALDWRVQLRRHRRGLLIAVAIVAATATGLAAARRRSRAGIASRR